MMHIKRSLEISMDMAFQDTLGFCFRETDKMCIPISFYSIFNVWLKCHFFSTAFYDYKG